MSKLSDLDPRLEGWADAMDHKPGSACDTCGRSAEACVVDEYSGGWFCDDCICAAIDDVPRPREVVYPRGHWRSYRHPY